jgi:hypothetical protein
MALCPIIIPLEELGTPRPELANVSVLLMREPSMAPLAALHIAFLGGKSIDIAKTQVPMTVRAVGARIQLSRASGIVASRFKVYGAAELADAFVAVRGVGVEEILVLVSLEACLLYLVL